MTLPLWVVWLLLIFAAIGLVSSGLAGWWWAVQWHDRRRRQRVTEAWLTTQLRADHTPVDPFR
jgi:hypothetical protein